MKIKIVFLIIMSLVLMNNCTGYNKSNTNTQLFYGLVFSDSPILNNLAIANVGSSFMMLSQPTFRMRGNPTPTVNAYIGLEGTISVSGQTVSDFLQGPIDVSVTPYQFDGLSADTVYRIYVVAENTNGYSVMRITQSTSFIAPVLNALSISAVDTSSITMDAPSLSTAGNPLPSVEAYIGYAGGASPISVTPSSTGYTVTNALYGPFDVSSGGHQFTGLLSNTLYKIIVVAENMDVGGTYHQSIVSIQESTTGIAPVMDPLVTTTIPPTLSTITLDQPTFSVAGNPLPMISAYIGVDGFISIVGTSVSGAVQGPIDVSAGYTFVGLDNFHTYRIIVIAQNPIGFSIQQTVQSTTGIAPALNALVTTTVLPTLTTITLDLPSLSTGGNPVPAVQAYIGVNGFISWDGSTVYNYIQGPIDVSAAGYTFAGLSNGTVYRIIVVAQNIVGASEQEAVQSTSGIAPGLNALVTTTVLPTLTTITLDQPGLSPGGNPVPTVQAYIGINGFISWDGTTVHNYAQGPIDVSASGYTFIGLLNATTYKIIVVAQNNIGTSEREATQSTTGVAPVLNALDVATTPPTQTTITLAQPGLSTPGNPTPQIMAYIGMNGLIAWDGSVVSNSLQGPIDVSAAGYTFIGLSNNTTYKIIVVAQNNAGKSEQEAIQTTLP